MGKQQSTGKCVVASQVILAGAQEVHGAGVWSG
jgi:hypothetical protein